MRIEMSSAEIAVNLATRCCAGAMASDTRKNRRRVEVLNDGYMKVSQSLKATGDRVGSPFHDWNLDRWFGCLNSCCCGCSGWLRDCARLERLRKSGVQVAIPRYIDRPEVENPPQHSKK